jgi:AAA+ superfamily predicted ATPase
MREYSHSPRLASESSPFFKHYLLKFALNFLPHAHDGDRAPLIDFILCALPRDTVIDLIVDIFSKSTLDESPSIDHYDRFVYFLDDNWDDSRCAKAILPHACKLLSSYNEEKDDDQIQKRFFQLKELFSLRQVDLEILIVMYLAGRSFEFERMCRLAEIDITPPRGELRGKINNIRKFVGLTDIDCRKYLFNGGPLIKYCLLNKDLGVEPHVVEFIEGMSTEPLSTQFFTKFSGKVVPIDGHHSVRQHVGTLRKIIANRDKGEGVNVMLYGPPGTGKTEFSRSLGRDLGLEIYEINKIENDQRPFIGVKFRFSALKVCRDTVNSARSMVVVDEADDMLNGGSLATGFPFPKMSSRNTEKDLVNDFLDNSVGVFFWITNHFSNIEESTRRRFDYSIEFKRFTLLQRIDLWKTCIAKHRLCKHFTDEDASLLARKYDVNVGGMDIALRNYRRIVKGRKGIPKGSAKAEIIDSILAPHINLVGGLRKKGANDPVSGYSLEGLNIKGDFPIGRTFDILKNFAKSLEEKGERTPARNMNLLLNGAPGTGKTQFARFIAHELGRPLVSKKGSDLLSMWVGGSEKNIREAFSEAESDGGILFVDEADGLIPDRSRARQNWEVTQVNEFLSGMEDFRGILICATNFRENMDDASIRRFNLKVDFDYLTPDGKETFFTRTLACLTGKDLSREERACLRGVEFLTPGDFKVVRQKHEFISPSEISNVILIDALRDEVSAKRNLSPSKIGFSRQLHP